MTEKDKKLKENFIFPISKYQGDFTPQNLAFHSNLQEFSHRIGIICALEANGKISGLKAHEDIKKLWQKLDESKQILFDNYLSSNNE